MMVEVENIVKIIRENKTTGINPFTKVFNYTILRAWLFSIYKIVSGWIVLINTSVYMPTCTVLRIWLKFWTILKWLEMKSELF